eukprot:TRINITY_DN7180_c0_g1_i1.p1 TRINITY_DN7180_c0_g1~~TRINITY_DN7180_c0_g1_i1.p1  ORF type:complete len:263 (+),score=62.11 TRINITY_DN7180_c0_g1_i1:589-1377(+)
MDNTIIHAARYDSELLLLALEGCPSEALELSGSEGSALSVAVEAQAPENMSIILKNGRIPQIFMCGNYTELHSIASNSFCSTECFDIMLEHCPVEVLTYIADSQYLSRGTALHIAVEARVEKFIHKFLEKAKSYDVETRLIESENDITPLQVLLACPMGEKKGPDAFEEEIHDPEFGLFHIGGEPHDHIAQTQLDRRIFSMLTIGIGWGKSMGNCKDESVWKNIIPYLILGPMIVPFYCMCWRKENLTVPTFGDMTELSKKP